MLAGAAGKPRPLPTQAKPPSAQLESVDQASARAVIKKQSNRNSYSFGQLSLLNQSKTECEHIWRMDNFKSA